MQRYGKTTASAYGLVDNLAYDYIGEGNQLKSINDAVANITLAESADFKNYSNTATEYTYNTNGAMTKDLNKGITEIQYNSLNLPRQMVINNTTAKAKNYYTYSASGVKLRTEQRYDPLLLNAPVSTTTPANDGLSDYKNTDYVGNIIYETIKSNGVVTNKKRILFDGGYIENNVYHFYVSDHLGNNRLVANTSGTVIQRSHYYPFGMAFADKYDDGKNQPYKYNGKELDQMHGLNLYDYSARYYEPAIGRFTTVDPLAEKYYSISPYAYCNNNPLRFVDPTGMAASPIYDVDGNFLGTDDQGLKGYAIVMDKENFKQGMSHEEAKSYNKSTNDEFASNKIEEHYKELPNRPDYDGKLTLSEANDWYKNGKGKPLYVDAAKIDLSPISNNDMETGESRMVNFAHPSTPNLETGLVY